MMVVLPLSAQNEGEKVIAMPKAGDYAISISALPFVNFLGNAFNGTMSQDLDEIGATPSYTENEASMLKPTVSIMGKYFLAKDLAVRVNVGLITNNQYSSAYAVDDNELASNPLSEAKVIDTKSYVQSGGSITAGLEWRVGHSRVQGVFSCSALYMYHTTNTSYTYGNAVTEVNQNPSNSGIGASSSLVSYFSTMRTLKDCGGNTHTFGVVGSAGVEWFVASNISIGAEVNLTGAYATTTQAYSIYEGYNLNTEKVEEYTDLNSPASHALYFGTNNVGANLNINFYF